LQETAGQLVATFTAGTISTHNTVQGSMPCSLPCWLLATHPWEPHPPDEDRWILLAYWGPHGEYWPSPDHHMSIT